MGTSTARAYPNSARASSHFSLPILVESSTWPPAYRVLLLEMLQKNKFGTELFRSTKNLSIALGLHYRTIQRMIDRLESGHRFGKKRIVDCEPVLSLVYEANKRPGGKLRRQATYQLHPERLRRRMTERDYENESSGALCPFPPQPSPRSEPPPPAPQPKAEPQHRSAARTQQPKLTKRECSKLVADIAYYMRGGGGSFAKMSFREALARACDLWNRAPEAVEDALKCHGFQFDGMEQGP